jgi:hypothetical protein
VPWQRCPFHLQQNAGQLFTRQEAKKTVARELRTLFNAPHRTEAERLLREALAQWRKDHPKLGQWAEEAVPESLTVFDFPLSTACGCARPTAWSASTASYDAAPGGEHLPEPSFLSEAPIGHACRARRRVDDR